VRISGTDEEHALKNVQREESRRRIDDVDPKLLIRTRLKTQAVGSEVTGAASAGSAKASVSRTTAPARKV